MIQDRGGNDGNNGNKSNTTTLWKSGSCWLRIWYVVRRAKYRWEWCQARHTSTNSRQIFGIKITKHKLVELFHRGKLTRVGDEKRFHVGVRACRNRVGKHTKDSWRGALESWRGVTNPGEQHNNPGAATIFYQISWRGGQDGPIILARAPNFLARGSKNGRDT
jgi:hypothetical protein